VNSLANYARSWQRAAGFYEIEPIHRSFVAHDADADEDEDYHDDVGHRNDVEAPKPYSSLLRAALANESRKPHEQAVFEDEDGAPTDGGPSDTAPHRSSPFRDRGDSIFQIEPQLASPFGGSYGGTYGSLASKVNESSMRHAGELFMRQQTEGISEPDKEREPLLVKTIHTEDGKTLNVVVGQSTIYQTIFNSVNVLIGVGMLALPLAIAYSGWIIGLGFFTLAAIVTQYTAKLLAKCLDVDGSLITFSDLAYVSFGPSARVAVSLLFTVELFATCVALVILFADSLDALIPGWGVTEFKILCAVFIIPLGFLPLRLLSFTSIMGIVASAGSEC
jgi:vesicular inhibitory amino acid transporter